MMKVSIKNSKIPFFENALYILISAVAACMLVGTAYFAFELTTSNRAASSDLISVIVVFIIFGIFYASPGLLTYLIITTVLIKYKRATLATCCSSAFLITAIYYLVLVSFFREGPKNEWLLFALFFPIAGLITGFLHWRFLKESFISEQAQALKEGGNHA